MIKKIFTTIKKSLSGEEMDFTSGSISTAVFLLAIPMILELSLESVFALVDIFFVGKLGENAVAAVGLTEAVVTIVYSVGIGLSTAATAIVARKIGEKNLEAATQSGAQALIIAFFLTIIISLFGFIFAPNILTFLGASEDVVREGSIFTRIMLGGSGAIIFLFLINGIFRGAGDAAMAMKSLWIASFINIILCPIFILFFGLKGAAMATVVGRSTGVIYQSYHLFSGDRILKFTLEHFKLQLNIINSIIKIAWPATLQFLISSGSWIVLTRLVAEVGGTSALAGYQIAIRNFMFFILPAWGMSNAAATLVGQNLGAKKIERAEQSVMLTMKYNIIFTLFVTFVFLFFSTPIIKFFSNDPEVILYGSMALKVFGSGYVLYGVSMVLTQALNGAGDTNTPTLINLFCFWVFQIPFAYFLAIFMDLKTTGVFLAIPITELLIVVLSFYFFKRGRWKKIKI